MARPTDEQILQVLSNHRKFGMRTCNLADALRNDFPDINADFIRRRLRKMEAEQKVRRAPTGYATQICWTIQQIS